MIEFEKKTINFYISYFYQIRNMKPNMLPISTAMWDPKWFHDGKGNEWRYMDKNGVINGVRMVDLMMPTYKWQELDYQNKSCQYCGIERGSFVPGLCPFMKEYAKCIREKNPDFKKFIAYCAEYLQVLNRRLNLCLDTIVFIVYEAPYKVCGERPELQRWFTENGMELKEWNKDE